MSRGQIISLNERDGLSVAKKKIHRDVCHFACLEAGKVQRKENSIKVINFIKRIFHNIDFTTCSVNKEDSLITSSYSIELSVKNRAEVVS